MRISEALNCARITHERRNKEEECGPGKSAKPQPRRRRVAKLHAASQKTHAGGPATQINGSKIWHDEEKPWTSTSGSRARQCLGLPVGVGSMCVGAESGPGR